MSNFSSDAVSMDNFLDIGNGYPADSCLPNKMIKNATVKLFDSCFEEACQNSSPPLGYGDFTAFFRTRLADMLLHHSGRDFVDPEVLVPNAGVSHGLDMLCTLFCKNKPDLSQYFVFMEDTSYFLTMGMFADHNLPARPVRTDEDGLCVDDLRAQLVAAREANEKAESEKDKRYPLFAYIIPEFHNPTGSCLSESRRVELIALAAEFNLMVIADEVYQMLDFTDYIPRPDASGFTDVPWVPDVVATTRTELRRNEVPLVPEPLDPLPEPEVRAKANTLPFRSLSTLRSPYVITISSFSKILAPGLRVGWIEFPSKSWADDYNDLCVAQSSSCICHFASSIVAVLMDDSLKAPLNESLVALDVFNEDESTCPLYSHIHNLRVIYGVKYEILTTSLYRYSCELLETLSTETAFGWVGRSTNRKHVEGKYLPKGFNIQGYRTSERVGGYFLWIQLPRFCSRKESDPQEEGRITPSELLEISTIRYNLAFKLGNGCAVDGTDNGAGHGFVRMCFARYVLFTVLIMWHHFCFITSFCSCVLLRLSREELAEVGRRFCTLLADTYQSLQKRG